MSDFFRGKSEWDQAFASGHWSFLSTDPSELGRQAYVAALIDATSSDGLRVIDIGCGEGVLRRYLDTSDHYIGVDISGVVVEVAQKAYPQDQFMVADVGKFVPDLEKPMIAANAVVLNEMVYYLDAVEFDCLINELMRTTKISGKSKVLCVSICRTDKFTLHHSSYYWSKLFDAFPCVGVYSVGDANHTWDIRLFKLG